MSTNKNSDDEAVGNNEGRRLSRKEQAVLRALFEGERFGLELVERTGIGRGVIYVTLSRMEDRGLIRSRHEERPAEALGLPRRLYALTETGRAALGIVTDGAYR